MTELHIIGRSGRFDLFPRTNEVKEVAISGTITSLDIFPSTNGSLWQNPDINPEQSSQVETCVLITRGEK